MSRAYGAAAAGAVVVGVALAPLACVPGSQSPSSCLPPYSNAPAYTLSNMVKEPPLSSVFACAVTVWTLATTAWLRRERRSWVPLLLSGLGFACAPTGEKPAHLWVWHTTLLCLTGIIFLVVTWSASAPARFHARARAHRALVLLWTALGGVFLGVVSAFPDAIVWGLLRAYGVACAEIAAALHLALYQLDVMV